MGPWDAPKLHPLQGYPADPSPRVLGFTAGYSGIGTVALGLVSGVTMCDAEQNQGLSLQPCWACMGLGWAQRALLDMGH